MAETQGKSPKNAFQVVKLNVNLSGYGARGEHVAIPTDLAEKWLSEGLVERGEE